MCGRAAFKWTDKDLLRKQFSVKELHKVFDSYNIAPGQNLPVVKPDDSGAMQFNGHRFGLVPSWAKDEKIGYKMINARAETVMEKPAFRVAFRERRCIIPVSGFYEWHTETREPYYFTAANDDRLIALAGIWESWQSKGTGEIIESCAILTTAANDVMQPIHHRMPLMLNNETTENWMTEGLNPKRYREIMEAAQDEPFRHWQISKAVNKPSNNNPSLIEPVAA